MRTVCTSPEICDVLQEKGTSQDVDDKNQKNTKKIINNQNKSEMKKLQEKKTHGQRRHRKSEINLALFLFQNSFQGNHVDLNDVIFSDKIKKEKRQLALNARDAEGMPILINCVKGASHKTTEADHLECIKILVSTGIPLDSKDSMGKTCVHWCVILEKIEICRYLLQHGAPANVFDQKKLSPMHIAISKHLNQFVQVLCDLGSAEILDTPDGQNRTPLCHTITEKSLDIFNILLEAGADHSKLMANNKTLVAYTIEHNFPQFLTSLLKHKANLFPNGINQPNMIHLAAVSKDSTCLDLLTKHCSIQDLQSRDNLGKTPLMYAAQCGLNENLELLLNAKADTNITDLDGKTALHYTSTNANPTCTNILLSHNPKLLDKTNSLKRSAIHYTIINNNEQVLRALLDHGAKTDLLDSDGHTLIHYASEYSAVDCLEELISVGLSPNIPDFHRVYPIHYAVRLEEGEQPTVKLKYLKAFVKTDGLILDVVEEQGLQPLHWAVCMGFTEAMQILLINNVDPNSLCQREDKKSALHLACSSNKLECLEILLEQPKIKVDPVDTKGYTPLMLACSQQISRYTQLLLKAGANPDHKANDGKTPAHMAAANLSVDCLWLLSLSKANFDVKTNVGETPIQVACLNKEEACIRFLLTRSEVNAQQLDGLTALHIAVTSKNFQRTNLLLQHKANCNVIYYSEEKLTPLDIALENGDFRCIKLLQSYNARTAHSLLSEAAFLIQHAWKNYKKTRLVARDGTPFITNSSICTSSNASESVSVLGSKHYSRHDDVIQEIDSSRRSDFTTTSTVLEDAPGIMIEKKHSHSAPSHVQSAHGGVGSIPCHQCGLEIRNWSEMFNEENQRKFQERLARGEREIQLMRQLMRDTEGLLVRATNLNEEADSLISSVGFQKIKQASKEYLEEKRKNEQNNGMARLLEGRTT